MIAFIENYWPHFLALLSFALGAPAIIHAALTKDDVRAAAGWVGLVCGTGAAVTVWLLSEDMTGVIGIGGQGGAFVSAGAAFVVDILVSIVVSLGTRPRAYDELRGLVYSLTPKETFQDEHAAWREVTRGRFQCIGNAGRIVRRVEYDHIEQSVDRQVPQDRRHSSSFEGIARLDPAQLQILLDERCCTSIRIDEGDMCRAAAQGLDPNRTGSRESIQHPSARNARRQNIEQRFAQLVRGRAKALPSGGFETPAFQRTADHTHRKPPRHRGTEFTMASSLGASVPLWQLPHLDQPKLILPPLLHELDQLGRQAALIDERARLAVRLLCPSQFRRRRHGSRIFCGRPLSDAVKQFTAGLEAPHILH